jgi:DNA-binding response OmpR family regulator
MALAHYEAESPPTVLVVDDNPDMVDIQVRFFSRAGMVALTAYNGQQCLEKVSQGVIDAIVLDVMMPGMDGLEVCAALKKMASACSIPIILLTAKDDLDTHLAAMRLGVSEFVVKPARIQDLVARLQVHLECSRKAREMDRVLTYGVLEGATPYQYSPRAEEG